MAVTWQLGDTSEDVALIQRMLWRWHTSDGGRHPSPGVINGTMTAETVAALNAWKSRFGMPTDGRWDEATWLKATEVARYISGGRTSDPFEGFGTNIQTLASDRDWVIKQYQYLAGRPPTAAELEARVHSLQSGMDRTTFMKVTETWGVPESVTRIYKEVLGREPSATEMAGWQDQFARGAATRAGLRSVLATSAEGLLRPPPTEETPGQEDAKARIETILQEFGLQGLSGWAWEQVQSGHSEIQIIQDLRQTPEYKARFSGMEARRTAGLAPMSEAEYISYEQDVRTIMRRAGLPPGFYDSPEDYAELIANDVSKDEVASRIENGLMRVTEAPPQIRQAFAEMYGIAGDSALAALFIDPDKGEQALLKQARAAETKGWGGLFGLAFSTGRAEEVATLGLQTGQLRQGLQQIDQMDPLFTETVTENADLTGEEEGVDAVFGMGGSGADELDTRRRTRVAATRGGGGANVDRTGVNLGAAD